MLNFSTIVSLAVHTTLYVAENPLLESIDLSSLEEIRGNGAYIKMNSRLCFVGDISRYVSDTYVGCSDRSGRMDCSKLKLHLKS